MRALRALAIRMAAWMSGRRFERDLADELESHLEMHASLLHEHDARRPHRAGSHRRRRGGPTRHCQPRSGAAHCRGADDGGGRRRDRGTPTLQRGLLSAFSALSVLLACVGIYGVLAYAVSQRTREIGVRMALGARPVRILWLIVGSGARMAAVGLVSGIAGALTASRVIETLLFGIGPRDVTTFVFVIVVLAVIGLAAAAVPAFRASRVDPTLALRGD
jgi:hypothetical protein